jgi:DNA polymerase-4
MYMVFNTSRKIIHVDMDAFYASVEQRDNPALSGKPIAVGHNGKRGVVATASYEARKFGVHSALPTSTAKRLCPDLIFIEPRFQVYRDLSRQIRAIFTSHTDIIEPVALDEAYLDVTISKRRIRSAWTTAQIIRDDIYKQTGLTASAGVSYNKFLAKVASDMNKPNGQFLILPEHGREFITNLPIERFHGIGPATAQKMRSLGIQTGADLQKLPLDVLRQQFGKLGSWYHQVARAEDDRPVEPNRERKSASAETTFLEDVFDKQQIEGSIQLLANDVWAWAEKSKTFGRTVVIKIKWADFDQTTRSRTLKSPITDSQDFRRIAIELSNSVFPIKKAIRLVGVSMSNFHPALKPTSGQLVFNIETGLIR